MKYNSCSPDPRAVQNAGMLNRRGKRSTLQALKLPEVNQNREIGSRGNGYWFTVQCSVEKLTQFSVHAACSIINIYIFISILETKTSE